MDLDLTGRLALVTGSTRGIGFAAAAGLADMGADVIVNGRDKAAVDEAIAKIKQATPKAKLHAAVFDLGDGEVDFPGCHRVLKSIGFKGWLCVDLDIARKVPRASYERCAQYVADKLESIYV